VVEVFHDDGTVLYDLGHEFLVRCPRCDSRAIVYGPQEGQPPRFVCGSCGLTRMGENARSGWGGHGDVYFALPLWLTVSCVGHTLWAYHLAHVAFLERLVSADLRLRSRPAPTIHINKRLAARLPKWMLAAKHRSAVMRGLAKLRELAAE
jgi:ribosomal protein S27AE